MKLVVNLVIEVPSKSNSYRIVNRGTMQRGMLIKTDKIRNFEDALCKEILRVSGVDIQWAIPVHRMNKSKNPKIRPVNPLWPPAEKVDVSVTVYTPHSRCDTDNLAKAIGDAITKSGVWYDDNQVRDWHLMSRKCTEPEHLVLTITTVTDTLAMPSPLKRMEWKEQKVAEASLNRPDAIQAGYCNICDVAIGPYCSEEEFWLLPSISHKKVIFKVICGSCADKNNLDFKYRVLQIEETRRIRRFQVGPILQLRMKEIRDDYSNQCAALKPKRRAKRDSKSL